MSQRDSGYDRIAFDQYETPEWVTRALVPYIPLTPILEPACGSGKMSNELVRSGFVVESSDIQSGTDFFTIKHTDCGAIITNPPYKLASEFISHALGLMSHSDGFVAMLLRTDFDHAKSRKHLFAENPAFCRKIVLTKRIKWIEDSHGSPSFNHAWYCWDWTNDGRPPVISYDFQ